MTPRKLKKHRTTNQRNADALFIMDLYKNHYSAPQIAVELGKVREYDLSLSAVQKHISESLEAWRESQALYIDDFITEQLEQIRELKKEAFIEYTKSKLPTRTKKEKRRAVTTIKLTKKKLQDDEEISLDDLFKELEDELATAEKLCIDSGGTEDEELLFTDLDGVDNVEVEQTLSITYRTGDARYLELITKLLDQEARLLGYYGADNTKTTEKVIIVTMPPPVGKAEFMPNYQIEPRDGDDEYYGSAQMDADEMDAFEQSREDQEDDELI